MKKDVFSELKPENYYSSKREDIQKLVPNGCRKVLEIGCGNGFFLQSLPSNCEKWGVDQCLVAGEVAKKNCDYFFLGNYTDIAAQLPNQYFDLVVCNDVIEHMPDALDFFIKIKEKMTCGGYLLGSLPNIRYYKVLNNLILKKDWQYETSGVLDNTHKYYFTRKSLLKILEHAEYDVKFVRTADPATFIKSRSLGIGILKVIAMLIWSILAFGNDVRCMHLFFLAQKRNTLK